MSSVVAVTVDPERALFDAPVRIHIAGCPPGARIRLRLRAETLHAESAAEYRADAYGGVDLATAAPIAGNYSKNDPMGLFWSARFDEGAGVLPMMETLARLEPIAYTLHVEAVDLHIGSTSFARGVLDKGVTRVPVRDGRIRGAFFSRGDATACPAVVILGGSDGGNTFEYVAALLAARGFAALALAYFAYDDLPQDLVEIPLEYFAEAIAWLRARPEVGGNRVGVLGMSRGGELALLLGATLPDVATVVALMPSALTGGGLGRNPASMARAAWTLAGKPLAFIPPRFDPDAMKAFGDAMATGAPFAMARGFSRLLEGAGPAFEAATIPVERTSGPILLMSGGDDQVWPSTRFAELALDRLRVHGFAYASEHLSYPEAGHFACLPPYVPTSVTWSKHPQVPMNLEMGGTPQANAHASADAWPRIIDFLRQHLATSH
jgi:dienelactone hydrolase